MWMMGYNDSGDFNMPDSFNGRKLRPLIPRPVTSANNPSTGTPCLGRIHGTDFFGLNHHLGSHFGEQNKRDFNTPPVVVSSRWSPTPEQLRTLEELYRRGTRTPSADQIQHITAQLQIYGKIEGKNVFYWFQNHKARERQKRRRQMESAAGHHEHYHEHNNNHDIENFERNNRDHHPAATKTGYEVEQTKNWAVHTNCSTLAEESVSFQRSAIAATMADCRQGGSGWIQFNETGELQHRSDRVERNTTWQMMQLSSPSPPTHLINTNSTTTTTPTKSPRGIHQSATPATISPAMDLNFFFSPYTENCHGFNYLNTSYIVDDDHEENGCGGESAQTLQLFPLQSVDDSGTGNNSDKVTDLSVAAAIDANLTPCQFFEFLPLKN